MKSLQMAIMGAVLLAAASPGGAAGDDGKGVSQVAITWYGQSCFLVTTAEGVRILIDPVNMGDYKVDPAVEPDVVTVSHNHFDHNAVDTVSGSPQVIYGKEREGDDPQQKVLPVDTTVKGVHIYDVSSHHFDTPDRPTLNAIFVYEFDGLRLVHLGDLGERLSDEQLEKIGPVDILMIPVGGKYTIFGDKARAVVAQLRPKRLVIPMHFRTRVADFLPESADDFTAGRDDVVRVAGNTFTLDLGDLPDRPRYVVFDTFKEGGAQ